MNEKALERLRGAWVCYWCGHPQVETGNYHCENCGREN